MSGRAIIFGAGEYGGLPPDFREGDLIIAADGGLDYLLSIGRKPQLLVGDMDSLRTAPDGVETMRFSARKDDTDMALAIREALSRGREELLLYGGLGGRLDHTFANLQLLAGLALRGVRAFLLGAETAVTAIHRGGLRFAAEADGILSVFAYGGEAIVTEQGLSYNVEGLRMSDTVPIGVSNEFTGECASVEALEGTLLVFWRRTPGLPLPESFELCGE